MSDSKQVEFRIVDGITRHKACRVCNNPVTHKRPGRLCDNCVSVRSRGYYRKHYIARRKQQTDYHNAHKEERIRKNRERMSQVCKVKPLMMSFYGARCRSKKYGVPFSITYDDLPPVPEFCPVLGIPITCNTGKRSDNSPSIDRIDNSLGYCPGNVQVISFRANKLKNDSTVEELERVVAFMKRTIRKDS